MLTSLNLKAKLNVTSLRSLVYHDASPVCQLSARMASGAWNAGPAVDESHLFGKLKRV